MDNKESEAGAYLSKIFFTYYRLLSTNKIKLFKKEIKVSRTKMEDIRFLSVKLLLSRFYMHSAVHEMELVA